MRYILAFLAGVFMTIGVVAWLADREYERELSARVGRY